MLKMVQKITNTIKQSKTKINTNFETLNYDNRGENRIK